MSRERAVIVEWNVLEKCDWLYNNCPGDVRLRASCPKKGGKRFFCFCHCLCEMPARESYRTNGGTHYRRSRPFENMIEATLMNKHGYS